MEPLKLREPEQSEQANERVNAAERTSKVRSAEQANQWAVRANEQMDKQVAQYLHLDFLLFWPIVRC